MNCKVEIYIRPSKKILAEQKNIIYLKDICEIVAPEDIYHDLQNKKILAINNKSLKQNYLVTVTDIIKVIKKNYPDRNYSVSNIFAYAFYRSAYWKHLIG